MFKKLKPKQRVESSCDDDPSTSGEDRVILHPDAHDDGGLACNNEQLLKQQREAIMTWVKSMGKRLLTGSINLINTPFPVTIFEPRSYLEKLADVWVYPRYLSAAAACSNPAERMNLVVTYFVAGLHHAFDTWRKPFNPILGETWQAQLSDGTCMFMEQISHHPPVSAFHMEGPGGTYRFRGLSQPTVSIIVKHYGFKTVAKGYRYLEFRDGSRIDIHYPVYYIKDVVNLKGLITSNRPRAEVDGEAVLVDTKNRIKVVLNFGALKNSKSRVLRRSDAVTGFMYRCSDAQALKESFGAADLQQTPSSRPPHVAHSTTPEACSSRPAGPPAAASRACEEDSDEFESASESEYDTSKEARTDAGLDDEALARAAEQAVAAETEAEVDELANQASSLLVTGTDATAFASTSVEVPSARPSISASSTSKSSGSSIFGSKGMFGGLMKGLGASSSSTAPSVPIPDETIGTPLASIEGSWLSHLEINGKRTWAIATERPERWQPVADALASDCRVRADLVTLSTGDLKGAQKVKEAMEDRQRADKRIREAVIGRGH